MAMMSIKYANARCVDCKFKKLNLEELSIEDFSSPLIVRHEYLISCEHEDICEMWIKRLSELHDSYADDKVYHIKAEEVC